MTRGETGLIQDAETDRIIRARAGENGQAAGGAVRGALSMILGLALLTAPTAATANSARGTGRHKATPAPMRLAKGWKSGLSKPKHGGPLPSSTPAHMRNASVLAQSDNPLLHIIPFKKYFAHRLVIRDPPPSRLSVSVNRGPAPSPRPRFERSFFGATPHFAENMKFTRPNSETSGKYAWKNSIVTTVFWVGESAAPPRNPVSNFGSAWDHNWMQHYGGVDPPHPAARAQYIPVTFVPRQNPFYCALPYNDILTKGVTKPEARFVIPWFAQTFQHEGVSVCKDRWVAIRNHEGRVCYAQWSDVGPFRTDHWQYVFGNDRPKPNLNDGAGLDVSPAVRDFLGLRGMDATDWKFADFSEVPKGPWDRYGDNNNFVMARRKDFIFASR